MNDEIVLGQVRLAGLLLESSLRILRLVSLGTIGLSLFANLGTAQQTVPRSRQTAVAQWMADQNRMEAAQI